MNIVVQFGPHVPDDLKWFVDTVYYVTDAYNQSFEVDITVPITFDWGYVNEVQYQGC